MKFIFTSYV